MERFNASPQEREKKIQILIPSISFFDVIFFTCGIYILKEVMLNLLRTTNLNLAKLKLNSKNTMKKLKVLACLTMALTRKQDLTKVVAAQISGV